MGGGSGGAGGLEGHRRVECRGAKSQEEELKQVTEEEIAARKEAQLNTPLVAPELRLPAEGGVFLLEELAGKPVLQKVGGKQDPGERPMTGKNMLKRSVIPIASQVQTIELKGAAAKVRVHSAARRRFLWTWRTTRERSRETTSGLCGWSGRKTCGCWRKTRLDSAGMQSADREISPLAGREVQRRLVEADSAGRPDAGRVRDCDLGLGRTGNGVVWDFGVDK